MMRRLTWLQLQPAKVLVACDWSSHTGLQMVRFKGHKGMHKGCATVTIEYVSLQLQLLLQHPGTACCTPTGAMCSIHVAHTIPAHTSYTTHQVLYRPSPFLLHTHAKQTAPGVLGCPVQHTTTKQSRWSVNMPPQEYGRQQ